jgi:hypothetical protein
MFTSLTSNLLYLSIFRLRQSVQEHRGHEPMEVDEPINPALVLSAMDIFVLIAENQLYRNNLD